MRVYVWLYVCVDVDMSIYVYVYICMFVHCVYVSLVLCVLICPYVPLSVRPCVRRVVCMCVCVCIVSPIMLFVLGLRVYYRRFL